MWSISIFIYIPKPFVCLCISLNLCIFVHLYEPFVSLCAYLNYWYVCISLNLCIFLHSSEPPVSMCICPNHFSLSPVSTSHCAIPFWVVSECSYNPVFYFLQHFSTIFVSVCPSCPAVCMRCEADIFIPYTVLYCVCYKGDRFWPWFCEVIFQWGRAYSDVMSKVNHSVRLRFKSQLVPRMEGF